jgi:predicted NAD/FAD-dependent oxidoreductase
LHILNQHLDNDIEEVQHFLLEQFQAVTAISTPNAGSISTHRWKYAIVEKNRKS